MANKEIKFVTYFDNYNFWKTDEFFDAAIRKELTNQDSEIDVK